jgi:hypothetical protein
MTLPAQSSISWAAASAGLSVIIGDPVLRVEAMLEITDNRVKQRF